MTPATQVQWASRIAGALEEGVRARRVREVETADWIWLEIELYDERYPLTVDILASKNAEPSRIVYMLAGGAVNFRSSFFSPFDRNLAQYMRKHGALVIGVSAREDHVPPDLKDYAFMADWGLRKHRSDLRSVVSRVQAVAELPYEVLGHSYGGAYALDYAAHHSSELLRTIVLDIYSLDPEVAVGRQQAELTYQAHVQCLAQRRYHDRSYGGLKEAVAIAAKTPAASTEVARSHVGRAGNFSVQGLLDFSLVFSPTLPGIHTPITGLMGDWPLRGGHLAGSFQFADDPRQDAATFVHTSTATLREAAAQIGGGVLPVALERDYWAVNARSGGYELAWEAIQSPVLWVNSQLGYAEQQWGAESMRRAGNQRVTTEVVEGYGHADLLWGEQADRDVWRRLVK